MTTRCPSEMSSCRKHGAHCWCPPLKRPVPPTGVITIAKATNPSKESPPFQFTGDLGDFALRSGEEQVFPDLAPGEYTVTELPLADWGLLEINCDDQVVVGQTSVTITVKAFHKTTCTFVNTDEGCITVIKEVTGPDRTFDFTVDGQPFSIETTNGSGFYHIMGLEDGIHNLTELIRPDWFLTGVVCDNGQTGTTGGPGGTGGVDVDVVAGQVRTCTFSNTRAGRIIVTKITDPRNSQVPFEFQGSWGRQFILRDNQKFAQFLLPGTYTVTEQIPEDWDLTDVSCTGGLGSTGTTGPAGGTGGTEFRVGQGQTVECIFTNTQRGSLTLAKQIETVNGTGPAFEFDAEFFPNGSLFGGENVNFPSLRADTYQIKEFVPEGWDLTTIDCGSGPTGMTASSGEIGDIFVTIPPGQDVQCTFTNTERASISVNKESLGGTGTFTFDYSGPEGTGSFDITTTGSPGTGAFLLDNLVPGEYTVNERVVNDWAITAVSCSDGVESEIGFTVTLAPGQNVVCLFTNTSARTFIFNAGETGTVNVPEGFPNLEYWVIGGGGKGDGDVINSLASGGGGRSKVENGTRPGLTPGDPIQYVVGQGGVQSSRNGQDSSITIGLDTITASGGFGTTTLNGGDDGGGGGYSQGAGQGGAAGQAEPGQDGTPTGGGKGGDGLAATATISIFSGLPGIGGASFLRGPPFGGGGAGGVGATGPIFGTNGSGFGRGIGGTGYGAGTGGDGGLPSRGRGAPGVVVLRFTP